MYPALHLPTAGKLTQRTLTAAHVCTIPLGRLFVTDKSSKHQFLVDTGSDLCVYPVGSFRDAQNGPTVTCAQLMALSSTPTDGCRHVLPLMSAALVFVLAVGTGLSKLLRPVTETAVVPAKA
jgi:hypothetical protein